MSKNTLLRSQSKYTESNRHIITISGGVASAWVANWCNKNIAGEKIFYFNDTKWEHPDLYRFLNEFANKVGIELFYDNDGRDPEQVFYDSKMLGSNRTPICSKVLKAERLQKFVNKGDTVYFGIDPGELKRAARIETIYARMGCNVKFPLIDNMVERDEMFNFIKSLDIEIPQMYKDGFTYNNCHGGCVRAGKKQWIKLLRTYPDVYAERERVEREFSEWNNQRRSKDPLYIPKQFSFMKNMTLTELRELEESQIDMDFGNDEWQGECVGICDVLY